MSLEAISKQYRYLICTISFRSLVARSRGDSSAFCTCRTTRRLLWSEFGYNEYCVAFWNDEFEIIESVHGVTPSADYRQEPVHCLSLNLKSRYISASMPTSITMVVDAPRGEGTYLSLVGDASRGLDWSD